MASLRANCPICDGEVLLAEDIEETEIISCPECDNSVVVENIDENQIVLEEAPEIEEDWGE